jgi:predicted RNase H-like HicB family nuclease
MVAEKRKYTVRVERDEDGFWVGKVEGLVGVATQARTLKSLDERVREAIEAAGEPAGELHMAYPKNVWAPVIAADRARILATRANIEAQQKMLDAVRELKKRGLSLRDAAYLIGISFQRVQQLTGMADE